MTTLRLDLRSFAIVSNALLIWALLIPAFVMSAYTLSIVNSPSPRLSSDRSDPSILSPSASPVARLTEFTGTWSGPDVVLNSNGVFSVNKTVTLEQFSNGFALRGNISWSAEMPIGHAGAVSVSGDTESVIGMVTHDGRIALVEVSHDDGILMGHIDSNGMLSLTQWQTSVKPLVSVMRLPKV